MKPDERELVVQPELVLSPLEGPQGNLKNLFKWFHLADCKNTCQQNADYSWSLSVGELKSGEVIEGVGGGGCGVVEKIPIGGEFRSLLISYTWI